MTPCEICKCKNGGVKDWIEKGNVFKVCKLCHFFRYGRTKKCFIKFAKKVHKNRAKPRTSPHKDFIIDKKVFNKRRESIRRSDIRHGCNPKNTMSQRQLYEFVAKNPCFFCGGKATGLDRESWSVCYTSQNLKNSEKMVSCCFICNATKRSHSKSSFIKKMNRIARNN
jgi:hypothetical protein